MRTIQEYSLTFRSDITLSMFDGAKILSVGYHSEYNQFCLFAESDTNRAIVERSFRMVSKNEDLSSVADRLIYIGSVFCGSNGQFYHFYEELKNRPSEIGSLEIGPLEIKPSEISDMDFVRSRYPDATAFPMGKLWQILDSCSPLGFTIGLVSGDVDKAWKSAVDRIRDRIHGGNL